ncbi:MAG: thioredoxin domain-containing protein [Candidatus Thorarchaeota archaeon]|nr:MAG: thioredoxin domain-containing protein [Candidatus Thorarchaeota archaeon]
MIQEPRALNRLANEKSPYLLQHAENPVDWFPWSQEAFDKARIENKPIFLSIGYSSCHWCHVMAHESFEDSNVARLLNENFVSIKVDREERPDIDRVYMRVAQLMTGRGGWPLTIVMTPDKQPFFAATFIPKEDSYGQIGMLHLIPRLHELWSTNRSNIDEVLSRVHSALTKENPQSGSPKLSVRTLEESFQTLSAAFDEEHGGFGSSPKFPSPHIMMLLLREWKRTGNERALHMVEKTLHAMRDGGLFDQIGYGFHRYSTDSEWNRPHFEKMLYDQALLVISYAEAYQATKNEEYASVVREVLTYVNRDLRDPGGAYYSAEDADTENQEGRFYLWSLSQLQDALSPDEFNAFRHRFDITPEGNYQEETTEDHTGRSIPHIKQPLTATADVIGVSTAQLLKMLASAREKLLAARYKQARPNRDEKILADWNGLMIAALAIAARAIGENSYVESAQQAAEFILSRLRSQDGGLLHTYRAGHAKIRAFLDDYAFMTWGLIELYETTFEPRYLEIARDLSSYSLRHFWDRESSGFFFSSDDSEQIMMRDKETHDGPVPSGNSVSVLNMIRLARILGDETFEGRASATLAAFANDITADHAGHAMMLAGLDLILGPSCEVVIATPHNSEEASEMIRMLSRSFLSNVSVLLRATGHQVEDLDRLASFTRFYRPVGNRATAYVCIDRNCLPAATNADEMMRLIDSGGRKSD